jgi:hypothetical protein
VPVVGRKQRHAERACYVFASAGHWRASVAVTHPRKRCAGSTPARRTEDADVLVGLSGCGRRVFTPEIAGSNPAQDAWPGGGMADAMVSKAVAFGREGSSPSLATFFRGRLRAGRRALTPLVLVRPQPPELVCPGGETDIMAPSEGAGPGSIPGRGAWSRAASLECDGGTRRFERRGWGSIPHGDSSWCVVSGEW